MTPRLLILLLIAAFLLTLFLVTDPAFDADDPTPVETVGLHEWGHQSPSLNESLLTTTTTARARSAPRQVHTASVGRPAVAETESSLNGYPCGAVHDLPPCYVMRRESGGNPNAYNPTGCSGYGCFGLWQFSGEWRCHFGLSCDIAHWTPEEQTHAARTLWNHGAGCRNWAAC